MHLASPVGADQLGEAGNQNLLGPARRLWPHNSVSEGQPAAVQLAEPGAHGDHLVVAGRGMVAGADLGNAELVARPLDLGVANPERCLVDV